MVMTAEWNGWVDQRWFFECEMLGYIGDALKV
jgi:hypothetical protein